VLPDHPLANLRLECPANLRQTVQERHVSLVRAPRALVPHGSAVSG
jgi:hypothetical protein